MKLDYLFVGAHPDDCEIFAGGTILNLKNQGARVGILDLTRGEAGTFGDSQTRKQELDKASQLLGLDYRETLDFPDGRLEDTAQARDRVITILRATKPEVIFTFPSICRHPDHEAVHYIVRKSAYLCGLKPRQSETTNQQRRESMDQQRRETTDQQRRPCGLVEFIEFYPVEKPSFVIDVTDYYEQKKALVKCFSTQVLTDEKAEVSAAHTTFIRSSAFWDNFEGRLKWFGSLIGVRYGEGFMTAQPLRVENPISHFKKRFR
ncbi:N-acetyl-alpha-D-glucosaminyl L-malate deacetylase 1 [Spirochaetota bacterium]|nr:N-acetyl-alpha-D-glucosaminyl L-malate deacetylase 1 [Spirochaetota bacterium]